LRRSCLAKCRTTRRPNELRLIRLSRERRFYYEQPVGNVVRERRGGENCEGMQSPSLGGVLCYASLNQMIFTLSSGVTVCL
jgi:hypothetical protein